MRRKLLGRCFYCREKAASVLDHVVPASRGGYGREGNLVPACNLCNMVKLDWTVAEWRHSDLNRMRDR